MALTTKLPRSIDEFAALQQSDWIDVLDAVTAAERIAIPTGAKYVMFCATGTFYAKIGGSAVTAVVPVADVSDGTASLCNPTLRKLRDGDTHISVAAPAAVDVTLEYFAGI